MSGGHTPGPWSFDGPRSSIIVWGPDPNIRVCFMTSDGPCDANACLIAASPTMLEALEDANQHFFGTHSEGGTVHKQIQAAIASARGAA
jgi:hypothetical protein